MRPLDPCFPVGLRLELLLSDLLLLLREHELHRLRFPAGGTQRLRRGGFGLLLGADLHGFRLQLRLFDLLRLELQRHLDALGALDFVDERDSAALILGGKRQVADQDFL